MKWVLTLLVVCFDIPTVFAAEPFVRQIGGVTMKQVPTSAELGQKILGHYPTWYKKLVTEWFAHEPYFDVHLKSSQCDSAKLEQLLRDPRVKDIKYQAAVMKRHLRQCEGEVTLQKKSSLRHSFDGLRYRYETANNSLFKHVLFELPKGVKVRGLLGLKNQKQPRPLVVFRLGIFSSVEEFMAERSFVIQLFEQSPFHVLVLENSTSGDFIQNNLRLSFGGYDEGIQNILIAQFLRSKKSEMARKISSLHFLGVSLGGHGVLHAAVLDRKPQKVIDSVLLFCPVVQLKETFDQLQKQGLKSKLINYWASGRLEGLEKRTRTSFSPFQFLPEALGFLVDHYQEPLIFWSQESKQAARGKNFWQLNDFHEQLSQIETPVLSWITRQDQLVPPKINSKVVKSKMFEVVEFPEGEHCSLASAYDWDFLVSLLRGHILSQAGAIKLEEFEIPLGLLKTEESEFTIEVNRVEKSPHLVSLLMKGQNWQQEINLGISQFGYGFPKYPLTESEFQLLRRGIAGKLQLSSKKKSLSISWEN